jgi:hypothetical protein
MIIIKKHAPMHVKIIRRVGRRQSLRMRAKMMMILYRVWSKKVVETRGGRTIWAMDDGYMEMTKQC